VLDLLFIVYLTYVVGLKLKLLVASLDWMLNLSVILNLNDVQKVEVDNLFCVLK
jgi:hypothetical protein